MWKQRQTLLTDTFTRIHNFNNLNDKFSPVDCVIDSVLKFFFNFFVFSFNVSNLLFENFLVLQVQRPAFRYNIPFDQHENVFWYNGKGIHVRVR